MVCQHFYISQVHAIQLIRCSTAITSNICITLYFTLSFAITVMRNISSLTLVSLPKVQSVQQALRTGFSVPTSIFLSLWGNECFRNIQREGKLFTDMLGILPESEYKRVLSKMQWVSAHVSKSIMKSSHCQGSGTGLLGYGQCKNKHTVWYNGGQLFTGISVAWIALLFQLDFFSLLIRSVSHGHVLGMCYDK